MSSSAAVRHCGGLAGVLFGIVLIGWAAPASPQSRGGYLAGFFASGAHPSAWRMGWNSDTACYPDMGNCPGDHQGFSWLAEMESGSGSAWGLIWGTFLSGGFRLEASLERDRASGRIGESGRGVFYLEEPGRPWPGSPRPGGFGVRTQEELTEGLAAVTGGTGYEGATFHSQLSDLRSTTIMVSLLYDVPISRAFRPYLGAGFGYARTSARVEYAASYEGFSELDNAQDDVFSGGAPAARLVVGVSLDLPGRLTLALEGGASAIAETSGLTRYQVHANQEHAETVFQGLSRRSLRLVFRYAY